MARITYDSDDELPELAVIIGKYRSGVNSKTSDENQLKSPLEEPVRNEAKVIPTARARGISFDKINTSPVDSMLGIERPKSKRLALNKVCENRYLQSFNIPNGSAPTHRSWSRSEFQNKTQFAISGAQEKFKPPSCPSWDSSLEENDFCVADSTGLSDFIVNDSSFLEDSIDEEITHRAPTSTRRLCQGRTSPERDTSDENWSDPVKICGLEKETVTLIIDNEHFTEKVGPRKVLNTFRNGSPGEALRDAGLATPPANPLKTPKCLLSPKKSAQIPKTPHRPSVDAFWDPGVINKWNEEYSPQRSVIPQSHVANARLETGLPCPPVKKSQIKLSTKNTKAKNTFALKKREIAGAFLRELDESITNGKIAEMAALTGGVSIIWSKKLNTTAGRANWRQETVRAIARDVDGKLSTTVTYRHYASIELAEKVIDSEERLLNVIAHEFCHLANFMISCVRNNPHGKDFKIWASKCSKQFGNRGIQVTTKHSYEIDYKYVWECTNCGTEFKRHSKSIDTTKYHCGSCKGKLVQVKPIPKPKAVVSEYQLFVKENMRKVKEQNPGSPQKQVMKMVGKMYRDLKTSKPSSLKEDVKEIEMIDGNDIRSREELLSEGDIDSVMRKLNFLDLTSPCVSILQDF